MRGAGRTPGGLGGFLAVAVMIVAGAVSAGDSDLPGSPGLGLSLLPGWALTAIGAIIVLAGIVANLRVYSRNTSLVDPLGMPGLQAGGPGSIARSLGASGPEPTGYASTLG